MSAMHRLLESFLDLIFPPRCLSCDQVIHPKDSPLCPPCRADLIPLSSQDAQRSGKSFSRCVSALSYQGAFRACFLQYKFYGKDHLADFFAPFLSNLVDDWYRDFFDIITWVPVSKETLATRGYDQAERLAQRLAQSQNVQLQPLLEKFRHITPQSRLKDGRLRSENVKGSFRLLPTADISNKRILLIDDIFTSGATLEEAAKTLQEGNPAGILAATLGRTPAPTKSDYLENNTRSSS